MEVTIWNYTDKAYLTMKTFSDQELKRILGIKYQMKIYLLTMFIKLKAREEIYFTKYRRR